MSSAKWNPIQVTTRVVCEQEKWENGQKCHGCQLLRKYSLGCNRQGVKHITSSLVRLYRKVPRVPRHDIHFCLCTLE